MSDSLVKGALRTFINTFCKVISIAIAFTAILFILSTAISSAPHRHTSTISHPTHQWKVPPFSLDRPTILHIPIVGTIGYGRGPSKQDLFSIFQDIETLQFQPGVLKAVVLYIDTPGGTADDSDAIFRMLEEFKKARQIPIYAYVDGLCASGGIFVSLAADTIIATTPSIIGSIGTIMPTAFNVANTMNRLGIEAATPYAGKNKDDLNPFRPWRGNETATIQELINTSYNRFVSLVSRYRPKLTEEQIKEEGAKVYGAEKAQELGLIDEINDSYTKALEQIASSLEIVNNYQVIELRPEMGIQTLLGPEAGALFTKKIEHHLQIPGELPSEVSGKPLYLYQP